MGRKRRVGHLHETKILDDHVELEGGTELTEPGWPVPWRQNLVKVSTGLVLRIQLIMIPLLVDVERVAVVLDHEGQRSVVL